MKLRQGFIVINGLPVDSSARRGLSVSSIGMLFLIITLLLCPLPGSQYVMGQHGTEDQWVQQTGRNMGVPPHLEEESVRKVDVGPSGDYSLSIPLLTVPGRGGLDVNLALTYTPGIRVTQEASWVGTGWNLNIGSITRNPVVRMDEDFKRYPWSYEQSQADLYRDTYTITCPAGSGTIIQIPVPSDPTKYTFMMEDWRPWKITFDSSQNRNRFIVVTEDGTTYVFGFSLDGATTNVYMTGNEYQTGSLPEPENPDRRQMQWVLTAILSADYSTSHDDPYDPYYYPMTNVDMGSWVKVYYKYNPTGSENNKELFEYRESESEVKVSKNKCAYPFWIWTPTHIAEFQTEPEAENFVSTQMTSSEKKKRRLKSIRLYRNLETTPPVDPPVREVTFKYYGQEGAPHLTKRSFLKEVAIRGGLDSIPPYRFEYWVDFDGSNGPPYQIAASYDPLTHGHMGDDGWYIRYASHTPPEWHSQDGSAWNLSKATYPSGGTISFTYQSDSAAYNSYNNDLFCGPGTRLSSQTLNSGTGSSLYTYSYATLNGGTNYTAGAGSLLTSPNFTRYPIEYGHWLLSQRSKTVMYGRITETQPDESKIVSYYSVRDISSNAAVDSTDSVSVYNNCIAKKGLLVKREYLNVAGTTVKKEKYGYKERVIATSRVDGRIMHASTQRFADTTYSIMYDQAGQHEITTVGTNEYHPLDGMVWRNSITNSDGQSHVTIHKRSMHYPDLFSLGNLDKFCTGVQSLQYDHCLDRILEKHVLRDSFIVSSEFFVYSTTLGAKLNGCPDSGDAPCEGTSVFPRLYRRHALDVNRPVALSAIDTPHYYDTRLYYDSLYKPMERVTAVDEWGNIRESVDPNGLVTTTKFGTARPGSWYAFVDTLVVPIATIANCSELNSKVELCEVFRADNLAQGFSKIGLPVCGRIDYGEAGSYQSVIVSPGNAIRLTMDSLVDVSKKYIIEFDCKVAYGHLRVYRNSSSGNLLIGSYSDSTWNHVRLTCDFAALHRQVIWGSDTTTGLLLDNVRIYPVDAFCTSHTYDPLNLTVMSSTDPNGRTSYYSRDGLSRLARSSDQAKETQWTYFYSRSVGSGSYNSSTPNCITSKVKTGSKVNLIIDGSFEEMVENGYSSFWGNSYVDSTSPGFKGHWALLSLTSNGRYIMNQIIGTLKGSTPYRTSVWFKSNTPGPSSVLTLAVGDWDGWSLPRVLYDSVQGLATTDWQELTLNFNLAADDSVTLWIAADTTGIIFDYVTLRETALDFYDLEPFISRAYFDAFGAEIQSQTNLGDSDIVAAKTYDNMRRPSWTYKQYQVANSHNYDNDVNNHANAYYPQTNQYAHSQTTYLADPLKHPSMEGAPGDAFRIGSGKEVKYDYFSNASGEVSGFGADQLFKTRQRDENGKVVSTFTDKLGNVVAIVVDSGGLNLVTRSIYDASGQLNTSINPKGDSTKYVLSTLGLLKKKISPDAGTVEYLYDATGNTRLTKDEAHKGSLNSVSVSEALNTNETRREPMSLTMPGKVHITANYYEGEIIEGEDGSTGGGEAGVITVAILSENGTRLYSVTASSNESPVAEGDIILPKGNYEYDVETSGPGQFEYTVTSTSGYEFVYQKYDKLNRATEVGEYEITNSTSQFTKANAADVGFPSSSSTNRLLSQQFIYDTSANDASAPGQRNLKGMISAAKSYRLGELVQTTFYSYDDIGRVEWLVHKTDGTSNKKIAYTYDLLSQLRKKSYVDPTSAYNFTTYYEYDQAGRVTLVLSSKGTDTTRVLEAAYTYIANGQVRRLQLGNAQGVDYEYSARDWLTQINNQNLSGETTLPSDKFGMVLGYNVRDHIGYSQSATAQFNGNVSWMMYNMSGVEFTEFGWDQTSLVGYTFAYDPANRILSSDFGFYSQSTWAEWGWYTTSAYDELSYGYDNVGNITAVERNGQPSQDNTIDNLTYNYDSGTNRLNYIHDAIGASVSVDVGDQQENNYLYDGNGNMQQDLEKGIGFVIYDLHNLPITVYKTDSSSMQYWYDTQGNRIRKYGTGGTFYYNGADGKTEVISPVFTTATYNIWGNDNLGQMKRTWSSFSRFYYLKDHLGNIRVTVDSSGNVSSADDYYPFGMQMDGRSINNGQADTRYKFTGKERDVETGYDYFGARYYDSRIGRWMSVDPLAEKYPGLSPFAFVADNPVLLLDDDGREIKISGSTTYQATALSSLQKLTNDRLEIRNGTIYITQLGGENTSQQLSYGTGLIQTLNEKGPGAKTVTIVETSGGNQTTAASSDAFMTGGKNGPGSDAEVQFNPNKTTGGVDINGNTSRPAEIGLGHELIHAKQDIKGTNDRTMSKTTDTDTGKKGTLTKGEVKTRKEENKLRKEHNLPGRKEPTN